MLGRVFLAFMTLTLILGGCSTPTISTDNNSSESASKGKVQEEIKKFVAAKDVEGMLQEGPGLFAGDEYDQEKLERELDKFPKDISAEDAYNRLIYLLAEDYDLIVNEMKSLDKSHVLDRELPSGVKGKKENIGSKVNVAILLDASGSMNEKVSGGVKMDLAKQAIQQFAADLPEGVNVSLRVFGHKEGKSKKESCQSSETVYPLSSYDASSFDSALNKFDAQGWTPLAKAIRDAKADLSSQTGDGVENIVYVVSDGEETCGGDPVKEAKALHTSDMKAIVNIIGFDVSNAEQRALKEVARAGGGSYQSANSAKELKERLRKERSQLQEELRDWSRLSREDISKQRDDLLRQHSKLASAIHEMKEIETQRLSDAQQYLSSRNIELQDLENKLSTRYNALHDYIVDLEEEISEKIIQNHIDALEKIIDTRKETLNNQ